jgi:hypothetical protein
VIAQAAINGGADALALINTLRGMRIDLNTQKPTLGNRIGGLSGVGIHPVAVYMVYRTFTQCCKKANIPIIGIGGVSNYEEALELILAGSTGVGIGTALFRHPDTFQTIVEGIKNYLDNRHEIDINRIIGVSAYQELLSFSQIAKHLNIDIEQAKTLCKNKVLPGFACDGGWCSTFQEIDSWYSNLNGVQWANIVNCGILERLHVETQSDTGISSENLRTVLQIWQQSGIIEILEQQFCSDGSILWKIKFIEEEGTNVKHILDLQSKQLSIKATTDIGKKYTSVLENISMVFRDKLTIAKYDVSLSLSPKGIINLSLQDSFGQLLQKDREIVQYFLAIYLERLVTQSKDIKK